ncbi:IucA/IucC family protein [Kribbella flavida DSM 17836]|uniref:IucA/IucC family protein n=1 Tax=Kribbella flavida (strain DSM 17836 / JCM 10339 / NBRC 14399) TaxID=479435 RepID=D2Q4D4_KRIFD|nr:IucA/IucC family protein [Kribbella flavida]ADB32248.1 IucA/IucC family protein [Kribbella flavida DSM 17836]
MSWSRCSEELLAKLISQFCSEELLTPVDGRLDLGEVVYTFDYVQGAFATYRVTPGSVQRTTAGILGNDESEPATDPLQFLVDASKVLGLDGPTIAGYSAELSSTLAADARMAETAVLNEELADLHHTRLEGHLTGHPILVANKGRLGFSAADSARYTPEARTPLRLVWLAVRRGLAEFRGTPDLSEHAVVGRELSPEVLEAFCAQLVDPDSYVWMPCHPWQLDHVVRTQWARELATGEIVVLGEGPDDYLPTQSIRTMVNISAPLRYQVKLPLKILNTSVYRGIPPHCTLAAPMVTQWLRGLWNRDEVLRSLGAELLGEVASVTVRHPQLSAAPGIPYQWTETLGCIWRDPLEPRLRPGETAWPLAAVLHLDAAGEPLVATYIARSGTDPETWVSHLLSTLLRPLLHLMHHYGITVNPHGENLAIICDPNGLPSRLVVKDLVDDVNLSTTPLASRGLEPDSHDRVLPRKPWPVLRQYLVDALFLGVLNPLTNILTDANLLPENHLWRLLRGELDLYSEANPQLALHLTATALTGETFTRYPLNGYRLTLGYTDLDTRPPIPKAGTLPNALHDAAPISPKRSQ